MEYKILTGIDIDVLSANVTKYLSNGWMVSGSISTIAEGKRIRYIQPVIKESKDED